jgi:LSD1 subclass zinc finger protein
MGGFGSGRPAMRPVIENGLKLDLADLRRKWLFLPDGAQRQIGLSWTTNGETRASISMSYSTGEDGGWLRLRYRTQPYDQDEPIHVDETFQLIKRPQPFGGFRWFVVCPQCRTPCTVLYLPPGATRFRSRKGFRSRLAYRSQSGGRFDRWLRMRDRLKARVLRAGPADFREKYADWDFPPKPPWMRWATYNRLRERWDDLETKIDGYLSPFLARLVGL